MIRLEKYQFKEEYTYHLLQSIKNDDQKAFRKDFLALHPYDQAHFYLSLDDEKRNVIIQWLSPKEFSDMFQQFSPHEQMAILSNADGEYMQKVVRYMYSDDIADLVSCLSRDQANKVLQWLDPKKGGEVEHLLAYEKGTAGALMITEFVSVRPNDTVSDVINHIRLLGDTAEVIYYVYVTDEHERMIGVVSIRDLLSVSPDKHIREVMKTQFVHVSPDTDHTVVVYLLKAYDLLAVPVLQDGKLVGVITIDDVIDIMEEERKEEFEDMSATGGATDWNVRWLQSFKKRIVWLVVLLLIAFMTSHLIDSFHNIVRQMTMLVPFLPIVLGMGGNAGIQSLAIAIRRLSSKEEDTTRKVKYLLQTEFGIGALSGIVCAIIASTICYFVTGYNEMIAFVVGVSLFVTVATSTLFGAIVPVIINRLRLDPAIASGPFVTTINDLIGTFVYFTVAFTCYYFV